MYVWIAGEIHRGRLELFLLRLAVLEREVYMNKLSWIEGGVLEGIYFNPDSDDLFDSLEATAFGTGDDGGTDLGFDDNGGAYRLVCCGWVGWHFFFVGG